MEALKNEEDFAQTMAGERSKGRELRGVKGWSPHVAGAQGGLRGGGPLAVGASSGKREKPDLMTEWAGFTQAS